MHFEGASRRCRRPEPAAGQRHPHQRHLRARHVRGLRPGAHGRRSRARRASRQRHLRQARRLPRDRALCERRVHHLPGFQARLARIVVLGGDPARRSRRRVPPGLLPAERQYVSHQRRAHVHGAHEGAERGQRREKAQGSLVAAVCRSRPLCQSRRSRPVAGTRRDRRVSAVALLEYRAVPQRPV